MSLRLYKNPSFTIYYHRIYYNIVISLMMDILDSFQVFIIIDDMLIYILIYKSTSDYSLGIDS